MQKKKILIFISVFIIILLIVVGFYLFFFRGKTEPGTNNPNPDYPTFNPFGTGNNINNNQNNNVDPVTDNNTPLNPDSRFKRLTDFAVAGATFFEDLRLKAGQTEEVVKTIISPTTKGGRMEIQKILNDVVGPKPLLVVDGAFGKSTISAIKEFQVVNGLEATGKIDSKTNQYFFTSKTSNAPQYEKISSLRYVERATGHLYQRSLDTGTVAKISNTTIPGVYEAFFDNKANTIIYRYLSDDKNITSYVATLGETSGDFLPSNILDLSLSFDGSKYFYLTKNQGGVSGTIRSFGLVKADTFFSSPFTEWLSQFISDQKIYLTTKPSWSVEGSLFSLGKDGGLTKVFGGIKGLTTLANSGGSYVLYSSSANIGPKLGLYNTTSNTFSDLGLYGLPDKCVWNNGSTYIYCSIPNKIVGSQFPDSWYQGLVSFDDYFVKIDTITKEVTTLINSTTEVPVDAIHLFIDDKEETLFFINKKDSTLWSLDIR